MEEKERVAVATPKIDTAKVQKICETGKEWGENLLGGIAKDSGVSALMEEARTMQPRWRKYLHDFANRDVARPDFTLQVGGVPIIPRHELTTITGKAGQGKSYLNMIFLGALIRGDTVLGVTPLRKVERILFVDTEQSEYDVAERANAMFRAMGWPEFTSVTEERLLYLRLRQAEDNVQRADITTEAIEDFHPDIIFLDGITDFVEDLEDKNEASSIVARWLRLVDTQDCNVIATIHQNEGTESVKLREFVGSEIMRKSRSIIGVSVHDGHFTAKAQKGRPFTYDWRIDPFGNLTTDLSPAQMAGEKERKELTDLMVRLVKKRNKYDSRKQIYGGIGALSGCSSEARNEETYNRAKMLEVIVERYDGHKYFLCMKTGNTPVG